VPSLDGILKGLEVALNQLQKKGKEEDGLIETVRSLRETLNSPLLVTVLGEFSSGKSTFINALLGEKLLPMKQRETTATITKLQFANRRRMVVQYKDGKVEDFPLDALSGHNLETFLVENFKESDNLLDLLRQVTIELDNPLLGSIDIADTPGFNSEYNRHTEITTEFVKYSDLIVWLFSAKQLGKASEIRNLQENCKLLKPIGVINQIDRLNLAEGETVQENLSKALSKFDGLFERFFFVSALNGLHSTNGGYSQSGIPEFVRYLNNNVIPEAKARKAQSVFRKLTQIGLDLNDWLTAIIRQTKEAKNRIAAIEDIATKLRDWESKEKKIRKQWEADSQDVSRVLSNVERYFLITDPPKSIVTKASKYLTALEDFQSRVEELNGTFGRLEQWRVELNASYMDWENRYQAYSDKGFGLKGLADGICEEFFGSPFSGEKAVLNAMANEYTKAQLSHSQQADAYNRSHQQLESEAIQFDESVTNFLGSTLGTVMNKQFEKVQELSREVQTKQKEFQKLGSDLAGLEQDISVFYKQVFPVFKEATYLVQTNGEDLSKQVADFEGVIRYLSSHLKTSQAMDWSRIYNRKTVDNAIELRFKGAAGLKFSASEKATKENRQTRQV